MGLLSACSPTKVDPSARPQGDFHPETDPPIVVDRTPDPNLPSMDMIFVYRGNDDATKLERVQTFADELNEQVLLDKLIEYGVLEEGTEILSFEIEGDVPFGPGAPEGAVDGERIGILDLSQVPSTGTAGETMMLDSIADTFIENFELDKLKLLVNGANYESGHIEQSDEDYLEYQTEYVNVSEEDEAQSVTDDAPVEEEGEESES